MLISNLILVIRMSQFAQVNHYWCRDYTRRFLFLELHRRLVVKAQNEPKLYFARRSFFWCDIELEDKFSEQPRVNKLLLSLELFLWVVQKVSHVVIGAQLVAAFGERDGGKWNLSPLRERRFQLLKRDAHNVIDWVWYRQEDFARGTSNQTRRLENTNLRKGVQSDLLDFETDRAWVDFSLEENVVAAFASEELLPDKVQGSRGELLDSRRLVGGV